jgi:hypothetical protein
MTTSLTPPRTLQLPLRRLEGSAVIWQMLTVLGTLVMQVLWSSPAMTLLTQQSIPDVRVRSMGVFLVIVLLVYTLALLMGYLRIRETVIQWLLLGIFLFAFGASLRFLLYPQIEGSWFQLLDRYFDSFTDLSFWIRPEFLATGFLFILWRRALRASRHWVGPLVVRRELRFGMLAFLFIGFVGSRTSGFLPGLEAGLFLFIGLITLGTARISSLSYLRGGRGIPFERTWLGGVALMAGFLLVMAVLVAYLVGGPIASLLDNFLSLTINLILRGILALLSPVVYAIVQVVTWIMSRFELIFNAPEPSNLLNRGNEVQSMMENMAEEIQPLVVSSEIGVILRNIAIVIGFSLLLIVLFYTARQINVRRRTMASEEREREFMNVGLRQALRDFVRGGAQQVIDRIRQFSRASQLIAAARIRRIYGQLMELSERLGFPRPEASTPNEFLQDLNTCFPGSTEDLEVITQAYVRIRYGELPENRQEVEEVEQAWSRVRAFGRELSRKMR